MHTLEGKVAIVTRAAHNIGRAAVVELGREGAMVVAADPFATGMDEIVRQVRALDGQAIAIQCDVAQRRDATSLVAQTIDTFGPIDILVNCAPASTRDYPLEDCPDDVWNGTFASGVRGTLNVMQAAFVSMKDRNAKIINFGDLDGRVGEPGRGASNANSEAVRALTKTAAREWGRYGISANLIEPLTMSDELDGAGKDGDDDRDWVLTQVPMGRFGTPTEVARLVVFLASEDSNTLTGMSVHIDGGRGMFA